ncbi:MAG: hypothetical protein HUJ68_09430 [Clostridia bacterium]|nr:hypothetical protein [Clostridia bacterium]
MKIEVPKILIKDLKNTLKFTLREPVVTCIERLSPIPKNRTAEHKKE